MIAPENRFVKENCGSFCCRVLPGILTSCGALVHGRVHLMGTYQDLIQGAVVLVAAMMGALLDGTLDTLVCMTVHRKASFEIGFCSSMDSGGESIQESFSKLAKMTLLWYCVI